MAPSFQDQEPPENPVRFTGAVGRRPMARLFIRSVNESLEGSAPGTHAKSAHRFTTQIRSGRVRISYRDPLPDPEEPLEPKPLEPDPPVVEPVVLEPEPPVEPVVPAPELVPPRVEPDVPEPDPPSVEPVPLVPPADEPDPLTDDPDPPEPPEAPLEPWAY